MIQGLVSDNDVTSVEIDNNKVNKLIMDMKERVLEEKRHVSSKISDLCRYIAFGLVAVVYSLLTSESKFSIDLIASHKYILILSAFFAVVTILLDYLQFFAGYLSVNIALNNSQSHYHYDSKTLSYKTRSVCFHFKQITVIVGAVLFLYTIIIA